MKKVKKFLAAVLTALLVGTFAIGATGCDVKLFEESIETLFYQKIDGKEEYRVIGLGTVSDFNVVIPDTYNGLSITEIADNAFDAREDARNNNIKSVIISENVRIIGCEAFAYCNRLHTVTFKRAGQLDFIEEDAFCGCIQLRNIVIPWSVKFIGKNAFYGCSSLTVFCEARSKPVDWDEEWNGLSPQYLHTPVWYSTEPQKNGRPYWRYVDGVPTLW